MFDIQSSKNLIKSAPAAASEDLVCARATEPAPSAMRAGFFGSAPKRRAREVASVPAPDHDPLEAAARLWPHADARVTPSPDGHDVNVLLLLHGRGDTPDNYARLAERMRLPNTACISLPGLRPMPYDLPGREWFLNHDDEFLVNHDEDEPSSSSTSSSASAAARARDRVRSLDAVVRHLDEFIDALAPSSSSPLAPHTPGRWHPSRVHLFGFSDGGTAALHLAATRTGARRLGGVAAVHAAFLPEILRDPSLVRARFPPDAAAPTPLVLLCGERDDVVPPGDVRETARIARERHPGCAADVWETPGKRHGMIASEAETRRLMAFWGMTLARWTEASDLGEDVVEIAPGGLERVEDREYDPDELD